MTQLGKHTLLFVVAAVCGGGVAFFAGRHGPEPQSRTAGTSSDQSKTVLRSDGAGTQNAASTATPPLTDQPDTGTAKPKGLAVAVTAPPPPASDEVLQRQRQNQMALKLLKSMRTSSSASSDSSESEEKARISLQAALDELLKHLRQSELSRALIARRDTEGVISTFVKITPPTALELRTVKELLGTLQAELPPQQLVQFQNRSMLLLRQFFFDPEKVLVVYITQQFPQMAPKAGSFHTHLTTRPDEYRHHHNGEPLGVPQGESGYEGGPVSTPVSPDFRYYHFSSR
jgi:hypothetical protein